MVAEVEGHFHFVNNVNIWHFTWQTVWRRWRWGNINAKVLGLIFTIPVCAGVKFISAQPLPRSRFKTLLSSNNNFVSVSFCCYTLYRRYPHHTISPETLSCHLWSLRAQSRRLVYSCVVVVQYYYYSKYNPHVIFLFFFIPFFFFLHYWGRKYEGIS